LKWSNPDEIETVLEQGLDAEFTSPVARYTGRDVSSVLSGLAEGDHYFRIGVKDGGKWSAPVKVKVEFFPRDRLVLLLVLGGVVVLSTIGAILVGYAKTKNRKEIA